MSLIGVTLARRALYDAADSISAHTNCDPDELDFVAAISALGFIGARDGVIGAEARIPYTKIAARNHAQFVRKTIGASDLEPLYTLPFAISSMLRIFLYPTMTSSFRVASIVYNQTASLFVSTVDSVDLLACAREVAWITATASRKNDRALANIQPRSEQQFVSGPKEHFCENFSGDLLIPDTGLALALKKIRELLNVKNPALGDVELFYASRIFGVSFRSICRKCERLGLIPEGGASTLIRFICEEFGGIDARASKIALPPAITIELPTALSCLVGWLDRAIRNGDVSINQIAEITGIEAAQLVARNSILNPGNQPAK